MRSRPRLLNLGRFLSDANVPTQPGAQFRGVLEVIAEIARRTDKQPEGLRQAAITRLTAFGDGEARRVIALRDHRRRLHLLPEPAKLDTIARYEAHLSRRLTALLHEYEALQAQARGERTPLGRLDIQRID